MLAFVSEMWCYRKDRYYYYYYITVINSKYNITFPRGFGSHSFDPNSADGLVIGLAQIQQGEGILALGLYPW